ncbi:MAG TPA: hypothetical protein VGF95_04035 [Solirubrobacteraceae bacterium]|jgi:hypothetical protein
MTGFDHLERQLLERIAERASLRAAAARRRPLLRLGVAALVVGVATVAATVLTSGAGHLSIAAKAYAATDANDHVVHYVEIAGVAVEAPSERSLSTNPRNAHAWRRTEVWIYRNRSRRIDSIHGLSAWGRHRVIVSEETSDIPSGDTLEDGPDATSRRYINGTLLVMKPPANLNIECPGITDCTFTTPHPIETLRHLYREGKLEDDSTTMLRGRRLDIIASNGGPYLRVLVDPTTFVPVKIVSEAGRSAKGQPLVMKAEIDDYTQLPANQHTLSLLKMRPHPRARVLHWPSAKRAHAR